MALAGTGAICIWNAITPEGRDDFYEWHIHEHMPERVAIPGFLRGRRYIAITPETSPEFFTLYETTNVDVTTSAPYLERLNAPTDWTLRATSHFRDTSRALTRVVATHGPGSGGVLATLRFLDTPEGQYALQAIEENAAALADCQRTAQKITGVHLCVTNTGASRAKTAESRHRNDILAAPIGALLIEGCTLAAVQAAIQALAQNAKLRSALASAVAGYYQIEYTRNQ